MRTMVCAICRKEIGLFGWSQHVKKEKRIHGEDCYQKIKGYISPRYKLSD